MAHDAEDDSQETTQPRGEGRASAREDDPQSGSDEGEDITPDDEFEALWGSLRDVEKKVAQEYIFQPTRADAARAVGLAPTTVYHWDDKVWEAASRLVDRRAQGLEEGVNALSHNALDVLRRALDPESEVSRVEKEAAEYLLNRVGGKPTQKKEVDVQGGISLDETDEEELDQMLGHLGDGEDE